MEDYIFPMKTRLIYNCEGNVYLVRRFIFKTKRVTCMLHKFCRSDEDRALHDHPWSFVTIILWRGYLEHTPTGVKRKYPGMILFRRAEWRHRVELLDNKPSWTLVFHFRRRREWGYWLSTGWQHWQTWWNENCE